jgi:two-component system chemotaxis sensor kinase CheA
VFGEPAPDQPLWSYLAPSDSDAGLRLQLCWDQLVTDVLPFELAVLQMPGQLRWAEQTFALAYQPVERDGALAQIVVSIRDITAEIAAQRANALAHELALVIRSLMADREGFFGFLDEVDHLLGELASHGVDTARWLHTLKGNTAMFGFHWFSSYCHQVEDQLAEGATFDADCLTRLRAAWDSSLEPVRPFLGQRVTLDISIAHDELAEQIHKMRDAGVARELLAELERWRLEPVGPALERLARQADRIAIQQGKQLAVEIHGARLRFADDRMRKIFPPLVHAIRNAVDHGLETPDERTASGKPPVGHLTLTCRHSPTEFALVVTDDGRGINWDRVRDKAQRNGLPCATRDDLIEALFADGMSTTETVTDLSGRGVGMGALREVCVALGGGIHLESEPGRGTKLTCAVPCVL